MTEIIKNHYFYIIKREKAISEKLVSMKSNTSPEKKNEYEEVVGEHLKGMYKGILHDGASKEAMENSSLKTWKECHPLKEDQKIEDLKLTDTDYACGLCTEPYNMEGNEQLR